MCNLQYVIDKGDDLLHPAVPKLACLDLELHTSSVGAICPLYAAKSLTHLFLLGLGLMKYLHFTESQTKMDLFCSEDGSAGAGGP